MSDRLPAGLEASALCRQVETLGGFAQVLSKGDPDRGVLLLLIAQRGDPIALLERRMAADFQYRWARTDPPIRDLRTFIDDRSRIDPDYWLIELDIPDAERFIAETMSSG